jgi:hypothetical protein
MPPVTSYELHKNACAMHLFKHYHQQGDISWHCLKYIPLHYQPFLNTSFTEKCYLSSLVCLHI